MRAVENFLDMGHFPFVHTGLLGEEPHTEVVPYKVEITDKDEVLATECKFFQPLASPTAKEGFVVDYIYKVIRPYTVALYKSNPVQKDRLDVITLFVQPVDEENCVAHPYLCYLKDGIDAATVRSFMQLIFAQDKPILENQVPQAAAARSARRDADPRGCRSRSPTGAGCATGPSPTAPFRPRPERSMLASDARDAKDMTMIQTRCSDPVILNLWHPIGAIAETPVNTVVETVLLGGAGQLRSRRGWRSRSVEVPP